MNWLSHKDEGKWVGRQISGNKNKLHLSKTLGSRLLVFSVPSFQYRKLENKVSFYLTVC